MPLPKPQPNHAPLLPFQPPPLCCHRYFAGLAEERRKLQALASPGFGQLQTLYATLRGQKALSLADLLAGAETADIPPHTVCKVLEAARIPTDKHINLLEVVMLLLSMSCDGLATTLKGAFEVLGGAADADLPTATILDVLEVLGARDPELHSGVVREVSEALTGQLAASYQVLQGVPVLAPKLLS